MEDSSWGRLLWLRKKRNQDLFNTNAAFCKQAAKAQEKKNEWRAKLNDVMADLEEMKAKFESATT